MAGTLKERGAVTAEALRLPNPSQELMIKALKTYPLLPDHWDAGFIIFPNPPLSGLDQYLESAEKANVNPFVAQFLRFDGSTFIPDPRGAIGVSSDLDRFKPNWLYEKDQSLRSKIDAVHDIIAQGLTSGKKPNRVAFYDGAGRGFNALRERYMNILINQGRKLEGAGLEVEREYGDKGKIESRTVLSIDSNSIEFWRNGKLLHENQLVTKLLKDDRALKAWFKGFQEEAQGLYNH